MTMKKSTCKNCGAVFADALDKCPYCGTMNKKGAYKKFRQKVSAFIDGLLGLREDTHRSISKGIFLSLLRSLVLIAIIVLAAYLFSRTMNVNYYNDREYDEKALEEILWADENFDKLDEAYAKGDYKAIEKLYYQNTRAVSKWSHYSAYCLKYEYKKIKEDTNFDQYDLENVLYFLFYPDYYGRYNGLSEEEKEEYQLMRESLITDMNARGYSEEELNQIYHKCADGYGYLIASDLKEYVKEEDDG